MKKTILFSLFISAFVIQGFPQKINIPATTVYIPTAKAVRIVENVLNSQYRRDISSVYVNSEYYKIGLLKNLHLTNNSSSYMRYQVVSYDDIDGLLLIKSKKYYRLIIKNRKGKEINKVLCSDLNAIYAFLDAIRNLKGEIESPTPNSDSDVISASDLALQKGNSFYKEGKIKEALNEINIALQFDTNNVDALFFRALCRNQNNNGMGAIDDYKLIIEKIKSTNPKYFLIGTVYNNLGYHLVEIDRLDEALPYINEALSLAPNESYIWSSRGEIYYKKGEYEKSIQDMTKSIELYELKTSRASFSFPDLSYYFRGLAEIKLGKIRKGCKDLRIASESGNKDADNAVKEYCTN